ncbi:hypothetical protein ACE6H2_006930 [Prunus campanulata]
MPPNPFASTGAAGTNASTAARNLNIQLEAIPELEVSLRWRWKPNIQACLKNLGPLRATPVD